MRYSKINEACKVIDTHIIIENFMSKVFGIKLII